MDGDDLKKWLKRRQNWISRTIFDGAKLLRFALWMVPNPGHMGENKEIKFIIIHKLEIIVFVPD